MEKIFVITRVLFLLNIREPISLVWNLLFPSVLFIAIHFSKIGAALSKVNFTEMLTPFAAYIIFSSSVYGTGLLFVYWRESGFLRTFVQYRSAAFRLILAQILLRSFFTLFYLAILLLIAEVFFNSPIREVLLPYFLVSFVLSILFSTASLILNALSVNFNQTNTVLSILLGPMVILSTIPTMDSGGIFKIIRFINYFNPIDFARAVLDTSVLGILRDTNIIKLLVLSLIGIVFSIIGFLRFRTYATENRG